MGRKGLCVWVSIFVFAMSLTLLGSCAKEAFKETPGAPQMKEKPYSEMEKEGEAASPSAMGAAEGEVKEQAEMTEAEREAAMREQALREQQERERMEREQREQMEKERMERQRQAKGAETTAETRQKFEAQSIYFDFDSAVLTEKGKETLQAKSAFLMENSNKNVLIEGHCDERGSVEYNLALGQRRAESAQRYLVLLGVNANRIRTISYGKERPADSRHSEEAWAKNRRDEFILE
ncbi:MAG: peptidoglycan-associated lipoprotein Pal [Deltaproteobacteria bacterium]|nr:peptidoglycan-associated lipoprotein Pal [Deltaproteobacteria bacterium]